MGYGESVVFGIVGFYLRRTRGGNGVLSSAWESPEFILVEAASGWEIEVEVGGDGGGGAQREREDGVFHIVCLAVN